MQNSQNSHVSGVPPSNSADDPSKADSSVQEQQTKRTDKVDTIETSMDSSITYTLQSQRELVDEITIHTRATQCCER